MSSALPVVGESWNKAADAASDITNGPRSAVNGVTRMAPEGRRNRQELTAGKKRRHGGKELRRDGTARPLGLQTFPVVGVAADRPEKLPSRGFLAPDRADEAIALHPAERVLVAEVAVENLAFLFARRFERASAVWISVARGIARATE